MNSTEIPESKLKLLILVIRSSRFLCCSSTLGGGTPTQPGKTVARKALSQVLRSQDFAPQHCKYPDTVAFEVGSVFFFKEA